MEQSNTEGELHTQSEVTMMNSQQTKAAKQNIKKAQAAWKKMSSEERAKRQPEGRQRSKPATKGEGDYYHVVVRDKYPFEEFRTQDVGSEGHTLRVAGKRENGSWDTVKWLINKKDAHVNGAGYLHSNRKKTEEVLNSLGSVPRHVKGDIFRAKPRESIPEKDKPTPAQKQARQENIQKAQQAKKKEG